MNLRARALGLSLGISLGLVVVIITFLDISYGEGNTLIVLRFIMPGYTVTAAGALVGLLYGIVEGFLLGALVAVLYNWFQKVLYK